jgi:hypothetical protein
MSSEISSDGSRERSRTIARRYARSCANLTSALTPPSRRRRRGSEKIGRLKPNGRLVRYSPLSRLVELEFLSIGITGKLGMWRLLQRVLDDPLTSADLASLIERAERQRSEVDEYRVRAAAEAFRAVPNTAGDERRGFVERLGPDRSLDSSSGS